MILKNWQKQVARSRRDWTWLSHCETYYRGTAPNY